MYIRIIHRSNYSKGPLPLVGLALSYAFCSLCAWQMEWLFREPFLQIQVLYVLLSCAVLFVLYKLRNCVLQTVLQHVSRVCLLFIVSLAVVIDIPVDDVLLYQLARLVFRIQEGQIAITIEVEGVDFSRQLVFQLQYLKLNFP